MIETEKQRRWWFATHPEFHKTGREGQKSARQKFAMTTWQNPAGPDFFRRRPTVSDVVATMRRALDYLQQNNPILMEDRDRTKEEMKKALDRAAKLARIAEQIAAGHAYGEHVVEQHQFPWVRSRQDFRELIARILRNPTERKPLKGGRTAYWDGATGTIVVRNPKDPDGGTAFRPRDGKYHYDRGLK